MAISIGPLRVVVAEDAEVIRELLRRSLSTVAGLEIVAMARDGVEALEVVNELKPDVLVLDISMPRKNGIEVLKEIRIRDISTVIIMFTADICNQMRKLCLEAGANFYVPKTEINKLLSICKELLADSVG